MCQIYLSYPAQCRHLFLSIRCYAKNITLNGKKTDGTECLKPGDTIRIFFAEETFLKFSGTDTQAEKKQGLTQAHALQKRTYSV